MIAFETSLLITLGISMGVNILIFFIAFAFKTDKLTDITYSLTFISLLFYSYFLNIEFIANTNPNILISQTIIFIAVLAWAIRIGAFLMKRIHMFKIDGRFDKMRSSFVKFFGFFFLQGMSVYIVFFPAMFYLLDFQNIVSSTPYITFGIILSLFGLVFESVADQQKLMFKVNGKKGFIKDGVWKISRHPNYFGEICFWVGILISVIVELLINKANYFYLLLIIPGLYIPLLLNLVSGIPLLELRANKKYASEEYEKYCNSTPILIPYIGSKKAYTKKFHTFSKK